MTVDAGSAESELLTTEKGRFSVVRRQEMSDATVSPASQALISLVGRAAQFASASKASSTREAYRRDLTGFGSWCAAAGLSALPASPQTVACYLADLARSHKVATLERALVAISQAHKASGLGSPTAAAEVREVLKGIRRELGIAPSQKAALMATDLQAIARLLPASLQGLRDRALLLVGFAGAFRRSELVALAVEDDPPAHPRRPMFRARLGPLAGAKESAI
jgi:site-specific recombinase XerD